MSRITINSNIASLNAQRNFGDATKKLSDSFTRLSSGLRINRSVDDAAGLSISESLKADTRIFNQGVRNINDGINLLSVADGALGELTNIITRLNELAAQSANGTLGNKQRLALDQEAQALSKEYSRIARTTEFNGKKLFDGDFGVLKIAAGGGQDTLIKSGLGGGIGDGTFQNLTSISTTTFANAVNAADVNGDGHADIILGEASQRIQVMLNNGNGTFKAPVSYASSSSSHLWRIETGDMNNDGLIDIIASDLDSGLAIFINKGDGTFNTGKTYSSGGGYDTAPNQVLVEDLNNDNILDVVTSNSANNQISVFLGKGDGTLNLHSTFAGSGSIQTIAAGDFNNDGTIDLSASYSSGIQETLLGRGDGSFKTGLSFSTGLTSIYRTTEVFDLNNDGNQDLVLAVLSQAPRVYLGNGDGSFSSSAIINIFGTSPTGVSISDFNGDGYADLSFRSYNTEVLIAINNGNGTFRATESYSVLQNYASGWGAAFDMGAADFNNDGAVDLLISNPGNVSVSVLFGNANEGVSALQSFSLKTQSKARDSMSYLKNTLTRLGQQRGKIGAFESRLNVAANNLQTASLNYTDANSRITDTDIAEEASRLTASRILQQSSASVLAQANQQPQLALKLLEGI